LEGKYSKENESRIWFRLHACNGGGACRMQRPQRGETGFVINALSIRVKILICPKGS